MSIDEIMPVLKDIKAIPQTQIAKKVLNAIRFSNGEIKNIFFGAIPSDIFLSFNYQYSQNALNEIAVKYISYIISLSTFRSFGSSVCNISYANIKNWFSGNGPTLGLWMMMDYVLNDKGLASIVANKAESLSALVKDGSDPTFVNGFLVECDTNGSNLPAKLFLNLFNVLDPSGNSLSAVLPTWQKHPRWTLIKDYNSLNWFETVEPMFAMNTDAFNAVKSSVDQATANRTGPYRYTSREVIDCTSSGAPIVGNVTRERYEYGESVLNWLNSSGGPKQYQMRSGNTPDVYEQKKPDSSGCVRENTPIRMADGSFKLIQDIAPGDLVLNGFGTISVCSKEKIFNPCVWEMYSINDEPVFMSSEHAIMTDRGWCSLNPYLSKELNSDLKVSRLEVGDNVWKFKSQGIGELNFEKIPVSKINIERATGDCFIGYDLHFTEGYDSYFARDYLCLLNYPEITLANIIENMKKRMSLAEEMRFIQIIRENDLLFRKAFGNEAIDMLYLRISQL